MINSTEGDAWGDVERLGGWEAKDKFLKGGGI
jgi:hypothetical protein